MLLRHFPNGDHTVVTARNQLIFKGCPEEFIDRCSVPCVTRPVNYFFKFKSTCIPDFYGFVHAASREQCAIGTELDVIDRVQVCRYVGYDPVRIVHIPDFQMCVPARCE